MADTLRDQLQDVREEYLEITEKAQIDNSVSDITYISREPESSRFNTGDNIRIVLNPTSNWLLPSKAYLYVEGVLVQADGTPYTKDRQGEYPNVTLVNNAIMHMFSIATYSINDFQIESFGSPGYATLMRGLVSKTKSFRGLDQCWSVDTYDGSYNKKHVYYPMQRLTDAEMHTAGDNPTAEEYRTIMKQIIPAFNLTNNTDVAQLADADLPCAGAHPTGNEVNTGFQNLVRQINSSVDAPAIGDPASIPTSSSNDLRKHVNDVIRSINNTIVTKRHFIERYNTGFAERKNFLFSNLIPDANAGRFSFRIPLSFIFNFCEDYDKVIFNCKHEISFTRQEDKYAIFRDYYTAAGKINLEKIKLYMPVITPAGLFKEELTNIVKNMENVPMVFRSKKIETFVIPPRLGTFSVRLIFGDGIDKPRFIVIGIQAKPNNIADDQFNNSIFNVPTAHQVDVKKITTTFNDKIITTDYVNNFTRNEAARWYNDFKNFRKSYYGDMDEDNLVDYQDYVNLYRIYVLDLSKQPEITTYGTANIRLDFELNEITPENYTTTVYALSFFDRMFMLKSDGTKQYVVQ